jgi:hypothetical protein
VSAHDEPTLAEEAAPADGLAERTLVFAHRPLKQGKRKGEECRAAVRMAVRDGERGLHAWRVVPHLKRLGQLAHEWPYEPFPALLEALLEEARPWSERLRVELPAEVEGELRRRAPQTYARLLAETRLMQRGTVFAFEFGAQRLRILFRAPESTEAHELESPLLAILDQALRGSLPGVSAAVPRGPAIAESCRLVTEVLRSRWVSRRLLAGVTWNGATRHYGLRHASTHPRLSEEADPQRPSAPGLLRLTVEGVSRPIEIDVRAGDDLPGAVIASAAAWLLDPHAGGERLYLDELGRPPRER